MSTGIKAHVVTGGNCPTVPSGAQRGMGTIAALEATGSLLHCPPLYPWRGQVPSSKCLELAWHRSL